MIDDTLYDAFGQRQVSTMYQQYNQHHVILELEPGFLQRLVGDAWARLPHARPHAGPPDPAARPLAALGGPFTLEEIKEEHVRRILLSSASIDEAARVLKLQPRALRRRLERVTPGTSPSPAADVSDRN